MKRFTIIVPVLAVLVFAGAGCQKKDAAKDADGINPVHMEDSIDGTKEMISEEKEMGNVEMDGDGSANDHFAKLFAQFKNFNTIDFRADMKFRGGENDGATMVLKRDAPDKHHIVVTSPKDGTTEMIYADSKSYIKGPGQESWLVMPYVTIPEVVDLYTSDEKLAKNVGDPGTAKYQGKKPCGTRTCHVYGVVVDEGTSVIAFDTKEFLLRTVTFTATNGDVTDIAYTYEDTTVTVPSDAQEIELPSGMTQEDLQKMMEQAQEQMAQ